MLKNQIIEASVQLFSRQGYKATTTRDIARLAGINESSIFRYFPRKEDVFWESLHSRVDKLRLSKELQLRLRQGKEPKVVLPLMVEFLVDAAIYHSDALRLLNISLVEMPSSGEFAVRERIRPAFDAIATYFEQGVIQGTIRPLDPRLTAVGIISTILADLCINRAMTGTAGRYETISDAVAAYSSYFLCILTPPATLELPAPEAVRIPFNDSTV